MGTDKTAADKTTKEKRIWFAGIYYILVVMLYVLNMFMETIRPGVFATVFMAGVVIELLLRRQITLRLFVDRLVAAYFIYNALSFIWLVKGGIPFAVYMHEFVVSLLPVIFYYVGRNCKEDPDDGNCAGTSADGSARCVVFGDTLIYYRNFIFAILIIGVLDILLRMIMPQFCIDYSYKLGFLSVAAMLASIPFIIYGTVGNGSGKNNSKGNENRIIRDDAYNNRIKLISVFGIISMIINLVVAFMSSQRSAMVAAIMVILYFNYLVFFVLKAVDRKYMIIELTVIAVAVAGLCAVKPDAVMKIYYRLVSLPGAIGGRSEQWIAAVNNMYSTWLGNGLGANSDKALGIEDAHVITDGGLVKIYCEQGIIGLSMFIYIIILSFKKGIKSIGSYYTEMGIVAAAMLQSVGSDILSFQLAAPIFWYAIGRINKERETDT